ncbi:MAG: hypothetical protein HWD59_00345 [Coxiellaceae bacterium]|nr:MAG: hypothetical protein HWD59_00345 [Coxiellaceae bacterium]
MAFRQVDSNLNLKWLQNTLASMSKDDLTKLQDNIQQQNQFFPQMHRKIEERKNYYSPETIQELGKLIQLDVETLIQSIEKKKIGCNY